MNKSCLTFLRGTLAQPPKLKLHLFLKGWAVITIQLIQNSTPPQIYPNLRDPKHRHLYIAVEHVVRHSYLLKSMDSPGESPGKHMKAAPPHKSNQLNIATATSANM